MTKGEKSALGASRPLPPVPDQVRNDADGFAPASTRVTLRGMTRTLTGGCQCGRIRYTAEVEPDKAILCHCKMCRRATGGVSTPYINVPNDKVRWHAEPDWYRSSPIAHRPFCAACGTPLGFAFVDGDDIDLTVGTFDDPTPFRPSQNYAVESLLTAWTDVRHLPAMTSAENPGVVDRWKAAGLAPPE